MFLEVFELESLSMFITSATIKVLGNPFVFRWDCRASGDIMQKFCGSFNVQLERIQEDLEGDDLIKAVEQIRQQALIDTFGSPKIRSKIYQK